MLFRSSVASQGTIVPCDATDFLFERFALPEWREAEQEWQSGRIGSRECMARQGALLRASPEEVIVALGATALKSVLGSGTVTLKDKLGNRSNASSEVELEGAFATRIAYVAVEGPVAARRWRLIVSDSDGENPVTIVDSKEPLMSPVWSPDGKQIVYSKVEGPTMTLTLLHLDGASKEESLNAAGLNFEAQDWSRDGKWIYFFSNRGGSTQLWRMPAPGEPPAAARRSPFGENAIALMRSEMPMSRETSLKSFAE